MTPLNTDILSTPGCVLIDDLNMRCSGGCSYLFTQPLSVIIAKSVDEVDVALSAIDDFQAQGMYLAGYIAYDAGLALDKPLNSPHKPDVPLIWLGVYDQVQEFDYSQTEIIHWDSSEKISNIRLAMADDEYLRCVERIIDYISAGDVYQVNFTSKLLFENLGTAAGLFARLRKAHPVCHSAFVNTGDFQVISISPELFIRKNGSNLLTRPMKGTSPRGRFFEEDRAFGEALCLDEKNRAENLMIVDLMRNDIGRICEFGGVSVPELFNIERYRSVFQMTSDVHGTLPERTSTSDILRASFPPGSITGAPKIRAMEIINELENQSRGIYCGSIGMFKPDGDFLLNVAIRTIIQRGGSCEMGIGSGIVSDSNPDEELKETLLKGQFLRSEPTNFQLLETILYQKGKSYVLLEEHLNRMTQSAQYFGWQLNLDQIRASLEATSREIDASCDQNSNVRVRLLNSINGKLETHWSLIDTPSNSPIKLLLSTRKTDPEDIFLYHKTTIRQAYDEDLRAARKLGYFDVLYQNKHGELTECAITNIALEIDGKWLTPPLKCGLLPGIWRKLLLDDGEVAESVLTLDDLRRATSVVIGNSVRGRVEVNCIVSAMGEASYLKNL